MLKKTVLSLAIGWTVLIAFLCLVRLNDLSTFGVSGADKYVHFTFHFWFTLLWGYYFGIKQNTIELRKIAIIVAVSVFYGVLIEFLQEYFTTTRHADIMDVLANLTGAMTSLGIFIFIKKRYGQTNSNTN